MVDVIASLKEVNKTKKRVVLILIALTTLVLTFAYVSENPLVNAYKDMYHEIEVNSGTGKFILESYLEGDVGISVFLLTSTLLFFALYLFHNPVKNKRKKK